MPFREMTCALVTVSYRACCAEQAQIYGSMDSTYAEPSGQKRSFVDSVCTEEGLASRA